MTRSKAFRAILWIVPIVLVSIVLYVLRNEAYQAGYDRGFSDGYYEGERENHSNTAYSIGYDAGYMDAMAAYRLDPDNFVDSAEESWPCQILMDRWIEVGESVYEKPRELYVSDGIIFLVVGEESISFEYTLPEIAYTQERPDGEVYLELENCREFVHLIFHEEVMDDGTILPVLSAVIAESDGRGEIVPAEFARYDDAPLVPADFRSRSRILREAQNVPPMERAE